MEAKAVFFVGCASSRRAAASALCSRREHERFKKKKSF